MYRRLWAMIPCQSNYVFGADFFDRGRSGVTLQPPNGRCSLSSSASDYRLVCQESRMTALCSYCARHLNLASPPSCPFDCNLSWQLRARGWCKSKHGKLYCPGCFSGYLDQPDIHRKRKNIFASGAWSSLATTISTPSEEDCPWQLRTRGWYKSRHGNWYCPAG